MLALDPPVALVLGGGGALGARQVGAVTALAEAGIRPDIVVGVSVGALNGAVLAQDPDRAADRLRRAWDGLRRTDVLPLSRRGDRRPPPGSARRPRSRRRSLSDPTALARLVEAWVGDATFDQLSLPFTAVAAEAGTRDTVLLDRGPLAPALLASSALPVALPPVEVDGRLLVDGGVAGSLPVSAAIDLGAATVLAAPALPLVPLRCPRRRQHEARARVVVLGKAVITHHRPGALVDFRRTAELMAAGRAEARRSLGLPSVPSRGAADPAPSSAPQVAA